MLPGTVAVGTSTMGFRKEPGAGAAPEDRGDVDVGMIDDAIDYTWVC